jgi:hypothetical protein
MPHFSLNRLLIAVIPVSIGFGIAHYAVNNEFPGRDYMWLLIGVMCGGGMGSLLKNKYKGATIGAVIGAVIQLGIAFYWFARGLEPWANSNPGF